MNLNDQKLSLYELLRFFNKTQEQFARDLGVSAATVNRWINFRRHPSHLAQLRITEVINGYKEEKYKDEQGEKTKSSSAA